MTQWKGTHISRHKHKKGRPNRIVTLTKMQTTMKNTMMSLLTTGNMKHGTLYDASAVISDGPQALRMLA
jgi:hypothetical protein